MGTLCRVKVVGDNDQISSMYNNHSDFVAVTDSSARNNSPDIVTFIGGFDINPKLYGQQAIRKTNFNLTSDDRDLEAWNRFSKLKNPPMFIGICRGGQFLNVMNGGSMWQHVEGHASGPHDMVNVLDGKTYKVTSTHHQMMIPGPEGQLIGIATESKWFEDATGIYGLSHAKSRTKDRNPKIPEFDAEIIWYPKTRSLCFQPHPEYHHVETRKLFFDLVEDLF